MKYESKWFLVALLTAVGGSIACSSTSETPVEGAPQNEPAAVEGAASRAPAAPVMPSAATDAGACGGNLQACCAQGVCNSGLTCEPDGKCNDMANCGNPGQACCSFGCNGPNSFCDGTQCRQCGMMPFDACCPTGNACNAPMVCVGGPSGWCSSQGRPMQ